MFSQVSFVINPVLHFFIIKQFGLRLCQSFGANNIMLIVMLFTIVHIFNVVIKELLLLLYSWFWVAHFRCSFLCLSFDFYNFFYIIWDGLNLRENKIDDEKEWKLLFLIDIKLRITSQWWKFAAKSATVWHLCKSKTSPACYSTPQQTQSRSESCPPQPGPYLTTKGCLRLTQSDVLAHNEHRTKNHQLVIDGLRRRWH